MLKKYTKYGIDNIFTRFQEKDNDFVITIKNGNRTIYHNNDVYITKKNDKRKYDKSTAKVIFSRVKNAYDNYIERNKLNVPIIKKKHKPIKINRALLESLPVNKELHYIDLCHAYWRSAYLLGIIPGNLYKKYSDDEKAKVLRNMALSVVVSDVKKIWYNNGIPVREISCDNSIYRQCYYNIRWKTYNIIGEIYKKNPGHHVGYIVDGIITLPEFSRNVKKQINRYNYSFKTVKCYKKEDNSIELSNNKIIQM